ncbi:type I toxin-antitoxin system Fst family toxin [Staphylococcus xylosus]|nr:type I toxin-antitoxin system Fst family toxin [Staphylococcus xylosus]MBG3873311.1 type I toxin-antitoxin system Fst family toxin [Staphylococcus xylosus]RIM68591.1 type I toxin-antitoxin system Fst family toxin [Staphylococcus xylosus]RIM82988.1 type I toxin-antitoxin system Fst family toxin [Staphylococcus xylosus]RIM86269.1 type I toxin-antitoxin system Fst family toxin [Staphylococcus xylosus]
MLTFFVYIIAPVISGCAMA